ncbi:NAD-specific glutamate dehydrogenase [compost metagenome]
MLRQAVGQCGSGRFVDELVDFQSGQFAGDTGGLALRVTEVRGDTDDRLGHRFAVGTFDVFLQAPEHQRGKFFRA